MAPVRILFIAPDAAGVDSQPEMRDISSRKHTQVTVLSGPVTARDIYVHARDGYDILHFVAHGGEEGVGLSAGVVFSYQEVAQAARIASAKIVFFNSCETGKPASYVVHHGVLWAIFGNIQIPDATAWQHPNGFYSSLTDLSPATIVRSLRVADNASGDYGYTISLEHLLDLLLNRKEPSDITFKAWQVWLVFAVIAVSIALSVVAITWGA